LDVLILGGYGAMAQSTVPDLLASPGVDRVGIGGRSEAKAKAFAAAQRDARAVPVPVDARDSGSLVREMKRWDCVINSSWYDLNVPIMEAAIEAGIHYCDLGGLYHQTLRQLKFDARAKDAGVTCVLGIGSTPGTMNVMGAYGAGKLEKINKVLLRSSGAVVSGGEPGMFVPPYAIRTIFDEFSMEAPILRKGKIQFVPALSGLERSEFMPPVGFVRVTTRSIRSWSRCRRQSGRASRKWTSSSRFRRRSGRRSRRSSVSASPAARRSWSRGRRYALTM